jgi:carbon-monoxide dehydrogenase medium subunit
MKRIEYHAPETLEEAVSLLGAYQESANILAGGTDLLVEIKMKARAPDQLVDIKKVPDLIDLTYNESAGLRIGALTTIRTIETSQVIQEKYAGLAQAAKSLGSIQIRNRATAAGNICRASPSADIPPPLIADDAKVRIHGPKGERVIALEDFFTGPGQTVLNPDEILVEIIVPNPHPGTGKVYLKHGRRKAMELATVGVAVSLTIENEICTRARVVLGAVAPTPIRIVGVEDLLQGTFIDENVIGSAARIAMEAASPISDVRSSAEYRRQMTEILTKRAISQALAIARTS